MSARNCLLRVAPAIWLCPNAKGDGPVTRHALWQTFKKVIAETGIKARMTPHSLRLSYATRLLEVGVNLRISTPI
jgi:site-specific recombinase XerD